MGRRRLSLVAVSILLVVVLLAVATPHDLFRNAAVPSPTALSGEGRRDLFVLPDDGPNAVLRELRAADLTIDIAVYLLTSDAVVETLGEAVERGVRVRVLLEPDPFGGSGDVDGGAAHLEALGVEVRFSGKDVRFSHIKTFVVDGRVALVTSLNLTHAALSGNRELGVISTEPDVVQTAVALFEADWSGEDFDDPGPLVVSPLNSRDTVEDLIASARTSIDVYAEVMRDEAVVRLLMERAATGVTVRLIVPDEVSPDDDDLYRRMAGAGVDIRTLQRPYQHAKMVLVDQARALIGSINFTSTSMDDNREAGIVLDDPMSAMRLLAVFESDWAMGVGVAALRFAEAHDQMSRGRSIFAGDHGRRGPTARYPQCPPASRNATRPGIFPGPRPSFNTMGRLLGSA